MMKEDVIQEIGVDDEERLYVKPSSSKFPMMYREAIEVHWDKDNSYLYGAKPRKWSYLDWFKKIVSGAEIQGTKLNIHNDTQWVNVPNDLQQQISELQNVGT